jgi:cation:H+ antiporter
LDFLILGLGIIALLAGTELAVGGAIALAKRHGISEFFVGLVILSIGSDLPEIAVAVGAGLTTLFEQDASGVVVGSAIGSVVAQIGLVLGITGLLSFLTLPRRYVFRHGAVLLGSTVLLFLAAFDGEVSRVEGLTMIVVYVLYLVVLLSRETVPAGARATVTGNGAIPWLRVIAGLLLISMGSELTVDSVVDIATDLEVSETVISALLIGLGTSLPELSISLAAIMRKKVHLSVGNIIGSNIFDTLMPISAAALIAPVTVTADVLWFDLVYAFFLTLIVLFLFYRRFGLQRWESILILCLYSVYVLVKLSQL